MYTTETKISTTPTNWFYTPHFHSQNQTDSNLPSRLEMASLLDIGASISVLNLPTYMIITQKFNVCIYTQHVTSKTLTIANQSEVPFKQRISVTCFPSKRTKSRYFMIPSAVADIKYSILRTTLFEEYVQKIKIQDFTVNFKQSFNDQRSTHICLFYHTD